MKRRFALFSVVCQKEKKQLEFKNRKLSILQKLWTQFNWIFSHMQMQMILIMMIMITMMMIFCSSGPPGATKGEECGTEQRCPHNCKCARGQLISLYTRVIKIGRLACKRVIISLYEGHHSVPQYCRYVRRDERHI